MGFRSLDCLRAEWQRECRSLVPRLPLIHVVGAQEVSSLPGDYIQRGMIEICQVGGESLGWPMVGAHRFHRISAARLLLHSRTRPPPEDRNSAQYHMLDVNCILGAPLPGGEIFRRLR